MTNGLETIDAEKSEIRASQSSDQNPEIQHAIINDVQVQTEPRGLKRPREDDDDGDEDDIDDDDDDDDEDGDDDNLRRASNGTGDADTTTDATPMSKNQQKKLKRQKKWEEKKQLLKETRKEKRRSRRERKKMEAVAAASAAAVAAAVAAARGDEPIITKPPKREKTQVPVTVIIDCQFEKYMMDKELVSLCSQVTRCYSDNRNAQFPVHLFISSYDGAMKTRFETTLVNQHQNWRGIHFSESDFVEVAKEAKKLMAGSEGGEIIKLLEKGEQDDSISFVKPPQDSKEAKKPKKPTPVPVPEADDVDKSIVYLTADSPYALERFEPNTSYVIGGIIDKNREKGLCYKLARERNVRTAKLPIGEFMNLQSRHVLATNHVMEIILKYLELGDWGAAFMKVIPPRKGGKLKEDDANAEAPQGEVMEDPGSGDDKAGAVIDKEQEDSEMQEAGVQTTQSLEADTEAKEPEVEGPNPQDGLQKNVLGEKEWSVPPVEREKIPDIESTTANPGT